MHYSRDNTPPNTPQCHRNAERERQWQQHLMDSLELCCTPQHYQPDPVPFHLANAHAANNSLGDDPFVTVDVNGNRYTLTPGIANQLANALPIAQSINHGRNAQTNAIAGPSRPPDNVGSSTSYFIVFLPI